MINHLSGFLLSHPRGAVQREGVAENAETGLIPDHRMTAGLYQHQAQRIGVQSSELHYEGTGGKGANPSHR